MGSVAVAATIPGAKIVVMTFILLYLLKYKIIYIQYIFIVYFDLKCYFGVIF